jgi:hypothetical protein
VHTGVSKLQSNFLMQDCRHSCDSHVDALLDELLDGTADFQATGYVVWIPKGIGNGNKVNTVELADNACVVTAHHAEPDEASAQICH